MAPKARKVRKVRKASQQTPARLRPTSICIEGQEYDLTPRRPVRTLEQVRTMLKDSDPPSVLAVKPDVPLVFQKCSRCGWGLEQADGYIRCMNVGCGHIQ